MKVGLISDIHANDVALEAVLAALEAELVGLVLCAGDLVCYGARPNQVLETLRLRGIPCVAGNYDDAVAWGRLSASRKPSSPATEPLKRAALEWARQQVQQQHMSYLRGLPWQMRYTLDGLRLHVMHAGPRALDEWLSPERPEELQSLAASLDADVVVLGHTHQAYIQRCGSTLLVNPGAVGRALDGDTRAAYAVLDTATLDLQLRRVAYDLDAAVLAIEQSSMPNEIAALVRHGARRLEEVSSL